MFHLSKTKTPLKKPTLQFGDQGSAVVKLQKLMNAKLSNRQQIAADGQFGATTEKVVKIMQYRSFLNRDGIVGHKTWQVLQTDELIEKPCLSVGSVGKLVGRVQQVLKDSQFYAGDVDEDFGTKTKAAVKALQMSFQLQADGIINNDTWQALVEQAGILTVV